MKVTVSTAPIAGLALALGLLCGSTLPAQAHTAAGPVTFNAQITMNIGSASGVAAVVTVPKGFTLTIQTISVYREPVIPSGSVGQLYLASSYNDVSSFTAVPENVADGTPFPGSTLNATVYCSSGSNVIVSYTRTGSTSAAETDYVSIAGTYTANSPPPDQTKVAH